MQRFVGDFVQLNSNRSWKRRCAQSRQTDTYLKGGVVQAVQRRKPLFRVQFQRGDHEIQHEAAHDTGVSTFERLGRFHGRKLEHGKVSAVRNSKISTYSAYKHCIYSDSRPRLAFLRLSLNSEYGTKM